MAEHKPRRFRLNLVNAAEDVPRLVRAYGRACDGQFSLLLRPRETRGLLLLLTKQGEARLWRSVEAGADAPGVPDTPIAPTAALALLKTEQRALPTAGPITLRGQWSGYLYCDGGAPRVELRRKLAAYGVLALVSSPEGWTWTIERSEKWFSEAGSDTGSTSTLLRAIEAGLARAMGLLGEACSHRDSRRRAAFDSAYAEVHPVRPAREGKDPTERMKVKEPRARKAKAAPPAALDAPVPTLPDAPATTPAMKRLAAEVTAEADALSELRGVRWAWADTGVREEVAAWFTERGLDQWSDEINAYDGGPDRPLAAFIDGLKTEVRGEGMDVATEKDALAQLDRLHAGWMEAPQLMERARKLIRHATRLAESPLCKGKEKREAAEAVARAVEAYEGARTAIAEGKAVDGIRALRRIGERVALSAAKAARSCSAGQTSLTAGAKETPARAAKPAAAPAKPKRTRAPRKPADAPSVEPAVDPEKDKALLDAFSAAITAAMKEVA